MFVHLFGCSLLFVFSSLCVCVWVGGCVCFLVCFCLFGFAFTICLAVFFVCSFSFSFLFPFLPHCAAYRVLVLQIGVGAETPRWESRVQDIGPPENSQPQGILIGKSSPRGLHLNPKTWLHPTAGKLHCWMPHAKQLARQEHNPTH